MSPISDTETTKANQQVHKRAKKHHGDDSDHDDDEAFKETLTFLQSRAKTQDDLKRKELELAERKDQREQAEAAARLKAVKLDAELRKRELRLQERSQALWMTESSDRAVVQQGHAILDHIAMEEAQELATA